MTILREVFGPNIVVMRIFYNFLINYGFRTFSEPTDILSGEVTEGDPVLMRLTEELHKKASEVQKYISSSLHIDSLTNEDFDLFISYSSNEVDSKIAKKNIYNIDNTLWHKSLDG